MTVVRKPTRIRVVGDPDTALGWVVPPDVAELQDLFDRGVRPDWPLTLMPGRPVEFIEPRPVLRRPAWMPRIVYTALVRLITEDRVQLGVDSSPAVEDNRGA